MPAPGQIPRVGDELYGYALRELVGEGGSAWVFRGESKRAAGEYRALKVLKSAADEGRLRREDKALQSIQKDASAGSDCFVKSYGVEKGSGWFTLIMDFFTGRPLARIGKRSDAFAIVRRIAEGLDLMHRLGMVHRDVTPNNILVGDKTKDPDIRIVDLGLVRFLRGQVNGQLSRGVRIGTLEYMPPDVYDGFSSMGPPSDIFALAGTLFFLLEGHAPFKRNSRSWRDSFPVPEDGPKELRELFQRATDFRPEKRYQDVGSFLGQLELCDQMTTTKIWRTPSRPVRRETSGKAEYLFRGPDSLEVSLWQCKELNGLLEFQGATILADWTGNSLKLVCPAWVTVTTPDRANVGSKVSGPSRVAQQIFRPNQEIHLQWGEPAELSFRTLNKRARYSCDVKWLRTEDAKMEKKTRNTGVEFDFAKLGDDAPQDVCRIVLQYQREEVAP